VEELSNVKGLVLAGSWHTIGHRELEETNDKSFGFRSDIVESRARLYVLSKIAQEAIVRFDHETSEKVYGIVRMGTVLGDGMPKESAANIFIEEGLKAQPMTPYKHIMHKPMLYVDIRDVCEAFESFTNMALSGKIVAAARSPSSVIDLHYPELTTYSNWQI
jgi:nucleoside-diphosphate-sugar epimerase